MARSFPQPRITLSRRGTFVVFVATLAALVVSAIWFLHARTALARAYVSLGENQRQLTEVQARQNEAQMKLKYAQSSQRLMQAATERGLQPADWGERLINLRQAQLGREETASLLASTARNRGALFGADTFELSVTRPDESLFVAPASPVRGGAAAAPLSLSLSGSLLFRTSTVSLP